MRITVKVPNSNGVAPGQTATWDLPIGRRYHALNIAYSGTTMGLPQMTELRIVANGEVIHRYSAADRDTMNQFDRMAAAAGILIIKFDRDGLYAQGGEEATAIQTGSPDPKTGVLISSFKLEIDIAGSAVAPAIAVTAIQSDNVGLLNGVDRRGPGLIRRIRKFSRTLGSAGVNEISDLPKGTEGANYLWLNRTFFVTANTLDVEIRRSNFTIFQRTAAVNSRIQANGVRTAQAGWFCYDPTEEGYDWEPVSFFQDNGLPYQDFRYLLNLSGAETVTAYVEYLGRLQG